MQEITRRLGGRRDDIWQDRYVYWMADAIEHILQQMRKEEECKMKTVYLLTHVWSDLDIHYDTCGVYTTRQLAEKAAELWRKSFNIDEDDDLYIEEMPIDDFSWAEGE